MVDAIRNFLGSTGIAQLFANGDWWKTLIMYAICGILFYLAVVKKFEPLLLLPIAFGMLLANLPGANLFHMKWFIDGVPMDNGTVSAELKDIVVYTLGNGGLVDLLYLGVKLGIYPSLIFLGIGAMTDFTPLIANPKSLLLGAAAQLGVF
ncbi:MAG: sodium ion-translocating decarboxylase subunit beta, partial [Clostridia bacterium]|nr:sodium ion-translocating decarboxylase subunit beta [Clostridia bacterium]